MLGNTKLLRWGAYLNIFADAATRTDQLLHLGVTHWYVRRAEECLQLFRAAAANERSEGVQLQHWVFLRVGFLLKEVWPSGKVVPVLSAHIHSDGFTRTTRHVISVILNRIQDQWWGQNTRQTDQREVAVHYAGWWKSNCYITTVRTAHWKLPVSLATGSSFEWLLDRHPEWWSLLSQDVHHTARLTPVYHWDSNHALLLFVFN